MSLDTGRRLRRYSRDFLPMSNDVISRVNTLGRMEGQLIVASNFVFKWDQAGDNVDYESESKDENDNAFGFVMPSEAKLYAVNENEDNIN